MFSLHKLEKFLFKKNFRILTYYELDGYLIYIKVLSTINYNQYLLYIPSKYEIKVENTNGFLSLKPIDDIEISTNTNNIVENYTSVDEKDEQIEKVYNEINLTYIPETGGDLESTLKENYDKPIVLKNLSKYKAHINIKNIINQLSRLKKCTKNIKYKLCIFYKNYIYIISRSDDINYFIIDIFEGSEKRQLLVTLDLEILYLKKAEDIHFDLKNVQEQVFKNLEQNHVNNMVVLDNMMSRDILGQKNDINKKLEKYDSNIKEFENMLERLKKTEDVVIEKINNIKEEYKDKIGFHHDIEKTNKISRLEREIDEIDSLIVSVNKNMQEIKMYREDILLKTDQILFDNSIMIYSIINNFEKLSEF